MKKIIEWDLLRPEDIEVRPATIKNGKAVMLLYQDGRCAVRALDRQFGSFGWQIDYKEVGDQIYGTLSIYDEEKGIWISKSDTGDKSNISEDKGQSSDILKRCVVRWGYATELYTAPKIEITDDGYGCTGYRVSEINYDANRRITHLVIINRWGKEAYRWDKDAIQPTKFIQPQPIQTQDTLEWVDEQHPQKDNLTQLTEFCTKMKNNGHNKTELKKFYDYYSTRMANWRNALNLDKLWSNWLSRATVAA